jgi:hypothetical protein
MRVNSHSNTCTNCSCNKSCQMEEACLQGQDITFASVSMPGMLLRPGADTKSPLKVSGYRATAEHQWCVQGSALFNKGSGLRLPLEVRLLLVQPVSDVMKPAPAPSREDSTASGHASHEQVDALQVEAHTRMELQRLEHSMVSLKQRHAAELQQLQTTHER